MAVSQVGDIIRLALQELEVLQAGSHPSSEDYSDGVDWLNVMISNWEADESLALKPNLFSNFFTTIAGTASYTAGVGGTVFAIRPIRIVHAYSVRDGVSRPLAIMGKADYNLIQNKTGQGMPQILYYAAPSSLLGTITFDRVPDAEYVINCDMLYPIGDYITQNDLLAVSPEYRAAMIYNLAVVLSGPYKVPVKPVTASEAKRTRQRIQYQAHNAQAREPMPTSGLIV